MLIEERAKYETLCICGDPFCDQECAAILPGPPSTITTPDGFVIDAETGEIVGQCEVKEEFRVCDMASAEWVMKKLQETDAEIAKQKALLAARVEALEKTIKKQEKRRAWFVSRFGPDLQAFAAALLSGTKKRTLETGYGTLSFRKGVQRIVVREGMLAEAITACKTMFPKAVKTVESILVSELKGDEARLPKELFEITTPDDTFKIDTGIK